MKMMTYRVLAILMAAPLALFSVACSGSDEELTAENITIEECNDLFSEDDGADSDQGSEADTESEEMLEGDYNADGDVDEDDEAIEARCEELMSEAEDDSAQEVGDE